MAPVHGPATCHPVLSHVDHCWIYHNVLQPSICTSVQQNKPQCVNIMYLQQLTLLTHPHFIISKQQCMTLSLTNHCGGFVLGRGLQTRMVRSKMWSVDGLTNKRYSPSQLQEKRMNNTGRFITTNTLPLKCP